MCFKFAFQLLGTEMSKILPEKEEGLVGLPIRQKNQT